MEEPLRFPNKTYLWTQIVVDELYRGGVRSVVIAPGSRSTPLTIAFSRHAGFKIYSHLDERSAAYFALGIGLQTGVPAALLCTSGTAAANFFPAIVEASQSNVPLLALTADRPQEARESGANQTIDQVYLYGRYVRWFVDAPLPETDAAPTTVRYLRTLVNRAVAKATGMVPGPVQLNFPFRKPLEPEILPNEVPSRYQELDSLEGAGRQGSRPFTIIEHGKVILDENQLAHLAEIIQGKQNGVIICGPRCAKGGFPLAVSELARELDWPIFADPLSGVRYQPGFRIANISGGYDTYLFPSLRDSLPQPDIILQFGEAPTSKGLLDQLERWEQIERISIHAYGGWVDETHQLSTMVWADPEDTCRRLTAKLALGEVQRAVPGPGDPGELSRAVAHLEKSSWAAVDQLRTDQWWEGLILSDVVDILPEGANLFVANSLPIRHLDQFGRPSAKMIHVYGNRGASGIDGTISTAIGVAASSFEPTVLVTGDLSLYHDSNGLLAIRRFNIPLTIVLIHNDGGGIFNRLPVAKYDPPYTDLFRTPHGLDFAPLAEMYGLDFVRIDDHHQLNTILAERIHKAQSNRKAAIIELITDVSHNDQMRKLLVNKLNSDLRGL